jgi:hypothetical protein
MLGPVEWYTLMEDEDYFNVHRSVHRNNNLVYKSQQEAEVIEFIFV